MILSDLLKLAKSFGLSREYLTKLALEQGIPFARSWVMNEAREKMTKAVPKIVANLAAKAPLDGQKRKDKDGIEFDDWAFLAHEALYLLVKAVVRKGGLFIDGWRDAHLSKVLALVADSDKSTPEAVIRATMEAELAVTF